ncbi:MAG: hypothetical protein K2K05_10040, partial [Muribaculaceae bacterium]|nr:hypothetical protein [Muribaculaceae bacterium]
SGAIVMSDAAGEVLVTLGLTEGEVGGEVCDSSAIEMSELPCRAGIKKARAPEGRGHMDGEVNSD